MKFTPRSTARWRAAIDSSSFTARQVFAGLLWTKQFYHFNVDLWLTGDPASPPPPSSFRDLGGTRAGEPFGRLGRPKYCSGGAVYRKTFEVPRDRLDAGASLELDLARSSAWPESR